MGDREALLGIVAEVGLRVTTQRNDVTKPPSPMRLLVATAAPFCSCSSLFLILLVLFLYSPLNNSK